MANKKYVRGSAMTFPLELTETKEVSYEMDDMYLYPKEILGIQKEIEDMCNRMEGDGSLLYDEYPDKVLVMTMAKKIAEKVMNSDLYKDNNKDGNDKWFLPLVQVMLCKEINFRKDRRNKHKSQIRNAQ